MVMETRILANEMFEVAEIELIYKSKVKASQRPKISSSRHAYELLLKSWDEGKIEFIEQFKILLLNRGNKVMAVFEVSTGGITGTVADCRVIFAAAIKINACGLILAHNHPSSSLKPSHSDDQLTEKIKEAGKLLDIQLLDHLIVSKESYYSYADEGVL